MSTLPIRAVTTYTRSIDGHRVTVEKWITGYAYARNGNAHNPTPRITWVWFVDGRRLGTARTRREAWEHAKEYLRIDLGETV